MIETYVNTLWTVLLAPIDLWLIVGILLAALVTAPHCLQGVAWTQGVGGMLLVLPVSLPLYVCTTGSVPIAGRLLLAFRRPQVWGHELREQRPTPPPGEPLFPRELWQRPVDKRNSDVDPVNLMRFEGFLDVSSIDTRRSADQPHDPRTADPIDR
jgi:hypothetical protein